MESEADVWGNLILEHENKMLKQNEGVTDVMIKYRNFMKFDVVEDYSDHHFAKSKPVKNPSNDWHKKIQQEWKILKKNLPDMIYVRGYESRMELLRAVIKGTEGTPYHDGLFFFDVCFPKSYPRDPPQVYYHSHGLRINPNLYNNGKVCLSLLNTWSGAKEEHWRPKLSTMLQVLVSIQGIILNAKPYFNEPGYERSMGSVSGETRSTIYNKHTQILSLKTMVYTMKKPPRHFENLVIGHFRDRAHGILTKSRAYYTEGIGVDGKGECSQEFRNMTTLVQAFKQIGAEDVDKFVPPITHKVVETEKKKKNVTHKLLACFGIL